MRLLFVAATAFETHGFLHSMYPVAERWSNLKRYLYDYMTVDVLVTGIGMVNTAIELSRLLEQESYDYIINIGVCGSYSNNLPIGSVCEIIEETYGDLGAETPDSFLTMESLGFPVFYIGEQPYYNTIPQPFPSNFNLSKVKSLTLNTVSGSPSTITLRQKLWEKDVENMEGASFFQIALQHGTPFWAFRAVSNIVEPRDSSRWNVPFALEQLHLWILEVFLPEIAS